MNRHECEDVVAALRPSTLAAIVADVLEGAPGVARLAFASVARKALVEARGEDDAIMMIEEERL